MSVATVTPTQTQRHVLGRFEDDKWHCACDPPEQAAFFQVSKETPNKGRWFYTCHKPRGQQCGFFLWEDKAQAQETLEQRSALSNLGSSSHSLGTANVPVTMSAWSKVQPGSRARPGKEGSSRAETPQSEVASTVISGPLHSPSSSVFPTPRPRQGVFRGNPRIVDHSSSSDDDSDATAGAGRPSSRIQHPAPTTHTSKRKRPAIEGVGRGGTADLSDIDPDDARELVELADWGERLHQAQQSQRSQFSDSPITPSRHATRTGHGGLLTPGTGNSFVAPSEPGGKRLKNAQGLAAPFAPTPTRTQNFIFADAEAAAAAAGGGQGGSSSQGRQQRPPGDDDADITKAVLDLLKAQPVSAAARQAVRERLNRHALIVSGLERGRNDVRDKLKSSKLKIAELQARVVELERERQMRRAVLRNDLEALSEEVED
ncbi:hypothetical protein N657DRAFT_639900 [Parathielavia appendiculata]|uniref:GRF-type domain-containing protein n=1 Tax=Parathielavia appendiculata TaxID=2587402 RepID=A0AAN6Z9K2_9PEZI|nr:hypothetical protein N657DRAFT_639900 [Parathielavia appendiculata]